MRGTAFVILFCGLQYVTANFIDDLNRNKEIKSASVDYKNREDFITRGLDGKEYYEQVNETTYHLKERKPEHRGEKKITTIVLEEKGNGDQVVFEKEILIEDMENISAASSSASSLSSASSSSAGGYRGRGNGPSSATATAAAAAAAAAAEDANRLRGYETYGPRPRGFGAGSGAKSSAGAGALNDARIYGYDGLYNGFVDYPSSGGSSAASSSAASSSERGTGPSKKVTKTNDRRNKDGATTSSGSSSSSSSASGSNAPSRPYVLSGSGHDYDLDRFSPRDIGYSGQDIEGANRLRGYLPYGTGPDGFGAGSGVTSSANAGALNDDGEYGYDGLRKGLVDYLSSSGSSAASTSAASASESEAVPSAQQIDIVDGRNNDGETTSSGSSSSSSSASGSNAPYVLSGPGLDYDLHRFSPRDIGYFDQDTEGPNRPRGYETYRPRPRGFGAGSGAKSSAGAGALNDARIYGYDGLYNGFVDYPSSGGSSAASSSAASSSERGTGPSKKVTKTNDRRNKDGATTSSGSSSSSSSASGSNAPSRPYVLSGSGHDYDLDRFSPRDIGYSGQDIEGANRLRGYLPYGTGPDGFGAGSGVTSSANAGALNDDGEYGYDGLRKGLVDYLSSSGSSAASTSAASASESEAVPSAQQIDIVDGRNNDGETTSSGSSSSSSSASGSNAPYVLSGPGLDYDLHRFSPRDIGYFDQDTEGPNRPRGYETYRPRPRGFGAGSGAKSSAGAGALNDARIYGYDGLYNGFVDYPSSGGSSAASSSAASSSERGTGPSKKVTKTNDRRNKDGATTSSGSSSSSSSASGSNAPSRPYVLSGSGHDYDLDRFSPRDIGYSGQDIEGANRLRGYLPYGTGPDGFGAGSGVTSSANAGALNDDGEYGYDGLRKGLVDYLSSSGSSAASTSAASASESEAVPSAQQIDIVDGRNNDGETTSSGSSSSSSSASGSNAPYVLSGPGLDYDLHRFSPRDIGYFDQDTEGPNRPRGYETYRPRPRGFGAGSGAKSSAGAGALNDARIYGYDGLYNGFVDYPSSGGSSAASSSAASSSERGTGPSKKVTKTNDRRNKDGATTSSGSSSSSSSASGSNAPSRPYVLSGSGHDYDLDRFSPRDIGYSGQDIEGANRLRGYLPYGTGPDGFGAGSGVTSSANAGALNDDGEYGYDGLRKGLVDYLSSSGSSAASTSAASASESEAVPSALQIDIVDGIYNDGETTSSGSSSSSSSASGSNAPYVLSGLSPRDKGYFDQDTEGPNRLRGYETYGPRPRGFGAGIGGTSSAGAGALNDARRYGYDGSHNYFVDYPSSGGSSASSSSAASSSERGTGPSKEVIKTNDRRNKDGATTSSGSSSSSSSASGSNAPSRPYVLSGSGHDYDSDRFSPRYIGYSGQDIEGANRLKGYLPYGPGPDGFGAGSGATSSASAYAGALNDDGEYGYGQLLNGLVDYLSSSGSSAASSSAASASESEAVPSAVLIDIVDGRNKDGATTSSGSSSSSSSASGSNAPSRPYVLSGSGHDYDSDRFSPRYIGYSGQDIEGANRLKGYLPYGPGPDGFGAGSGATSSAYAGALNDEGEYGYDGLHNSLVDYLSSSGSSAASTSAASASESEAVPSALQIDIVDGIYNDGETTSSGSSSSSSSASGSNAPYVLSGLSPRDKGYFDQDTEGPNRLRGYETYGPRPRGFGAGIGGTSSAGAGALNDARRYGYDGSHNYFVDYPSSGGSSASSSSAASSSERGTGPSKEVIKTNDRRNKDGATTSSGSSSSSSSASGSNAPSRPYVLSGSGHDYDSDRFSPRYIGYSGQDIEGANRLKGYLPYGPGPDGFGAGSGATSSASDYAGALNDDGEYGYGQLLNGLVDYLSSSGSSAASSSAASASESEAVPSAVLIDIVDRRNKDGATTSSGSSSSSSSASGSNAPSRPYVLSGSGHDYDSDQLSPSDEGYLFNRQRVYGTHRRGRRPKVCPLREKLVVRIKDVCASC